MSELSPGLELSHYQIVSKLGAGGMGEVYLAHDTKLDRKVALKILPAELASHRDRMDRFVREAKAAAALNHPNIAHIYEIGESDGTNFIAMEFVEGETLRQQIQRGKNVLEVLLRHLFHVAEGLAKAHASGIVHRDLKPDNIMITGDGHAKILDFGLAKLLQTKPESVAEIGEEATAMMPVQHSTPGVVMGTVGYMSPEQAQGKPVDQRSDIFSFGCILYEAATGRKPFAEESVVDTLHRIIHDPAPAITDFNPSALPQLQRIVRKCLAKDPAKRYQTIRDTANDLEELLEEMKGISDIERSVAPSANRTSAIGSTGDDVRAKSTWSVSQQPDSKAEDIVTGIKQHKVALVIAFAVLVGGLISLGFYLRVRNSDNAIKSIAVMPFVNESGNAEMEYLSDGMTESLINSLSRLPKLNVKARSSVFRYKTKEVEARQIGDELNVQAVLNGRVVQRGQDLILYLSLVDAATGNQIWGEQYNRKQADLIQLQTEIARDVSSKLRTKLSGADEQRLTKKFTANPEAYQLYLLGRFHWNKRNKADIYRAIEYYSQAVRADPDFAIAYSGLSDTYAILQGYDKTVSPLASQMKAREYALKALSLDETLSEAHVSYGLVIQSVDFDFTGAEREFKRAVELDPKNAVAYLYYALLLTGLGQFDEAEANLRHALELEPASQNVNRNYGNFLMLVRRYDESEKQLRKALQLDPNFQVGYFSLANTLQMQGRYAESVEAYARAREIAGNPEEAAAMRASFKKGGWRGFALDFGKYGWMSDFRPKYIDATRFASIGENQRALDALEEAFAERETFMALVNVDPRFDPLRDNPRFQDLLRRVGFAP